MRRTRHVVLPVRSWEHVGLMVVSLACLTLGLVSRDREGQAGNLAGPDLQHCAPHKVDACPNENVFTRLPFYDDPANPSGLNPTDHPVKDRDRSNRPRDTTSPVIQKERSSSDICNFRSTRQASAVGVSRPEARRSNDHRDVRLSGLRNDRRGDRVKDSRTAEQIFIVNNQRTSTERGINPTGSRREERSRQIRSFRSRERRSVDKDSRLATERRQAHLSDRQTERLLRYQRSSETRYDGPVAERRNDRSARRVRESRSLERDAAIRNTRLSNERRDNRLDRQVRSTRSIERIDNLIAERRNNFRSQRDQIAQSIRRHSLSRRSERLVESSAERRDSRIFREREDRVIREIRKVRSNDHELVTRRTDRSIERKGNRLQERKIRSSNVDFVSRNSRLNIPEISDDRSARRFRNAGSLDRVVDVKRNTQLLTSERRGDQLTRQIRSVRSTRDSETKNTRRVSERRNVHSTPESRDDQRAQRARIVSTLKRDFERGNTEQLSARRTGRQSNEIRVRNRRTHSFVEHDSRARNIRASDARRENRLTRVFRDISLNERRPKITDSRLIAERKENRQKREIRSLGRDSRIRNSEMISEQRDRRLSRQIREAKIINRDNSLTRSPRVSIKRINRDSLISQADFSSAERRVDNRNRWLRDSRSLQRSSTIGSLRTTFERRYAISSSEYRDDRVTRNTQDAGNFRSVAERRDERQQVQRVRSLRSNERTSRVRIDPIKNERALMNSLRNSENIRTDFNARETRTGRIERYSRYTRQKNVERLISAGSSRVKRTIKDRRYAFDASKNSIEIEKLSAQREQVQYAVTRAENIREIRIRRTQATRLPVTFRLYETRYGTRDNSNFQDARRLLFASTLTSQIPTSMTYEILRQTAVLFLCATYAASLHSAKGSLSRNIITYVNRLVVW
ncbi:uncharacterized protein LOC105684394 [Athalia rosae]|uniref:uncharacterized protein LOC105684394 n=1 Tax=Athalia rosae TaxID=37344 RepID=UPI0020341F97|nr:uncharacterized protein LOC105684394 [Athalia rosae]